MNMGKLMKITKALKKRPNRPSFSERISAKTRRVRAVEPNGKAVTPQLCRAVAIASLNYLLRILQPSGKFIYSHKLGDVTKQYSGYNLLRHCGTVWFMCLAIKGLNINLSREQASALDGAVEFVMQRLRQPPWLTDAWPCLGLVTRDSIKLGGVGLAMIMLHAYRDAMAPSEQDAERINLTIAQLENYAHLQISGGDFIHKRKFETGFVSEFQSEYYTGEALFGLMHGSRRSARLQRLVEGLMHQNYGVDVQSHWMAYAACKVAEREMVDPKIVDPYIVRLIDSIVRNSSYRERNDSTPIACRSEALCCFLKLSRSVRLSRWPGELVALAESATAENLRLQLQWYKEGQFWRGDTEDKVQIDYVQHNGTAFLNWYLLHGT
jgi:hypothetical protein